MARFAPDRRPRGRPRGGRTQSFPNIPEWVRIGGSWRDGDRRNSGPDIVPDQSRDEEMTGRLITTLPYDTYYYSNNDPEFSPRIANCKFVASYNWVDDEQPTILVPGGPPTWNPPPGKPRVPKDEGDYFCDVNSVKWPKHPIEPAIRALFEHDEDFDPESIDIVTTNATIKCLFEYTTAGAESFKIEVERIGDTVFMLCRQASPTDLIQGICGYVFNFQDRYTAWDPSVKGSLSNQRMVRYDFYGLRFLVCFKSDGYLEDLAHDEIVYSTDQPPCEQQVDDDIDDSSQATSSAATAEAKTADADALKIRRGGFVVPQKAIVDIKTRPAGGEGLIESNKQLLWARQTPTLVAAYHRYGKFDNIEIQNLKDDIEAWESENETTLSRLGRLFRRIISETQRLETRKLCVCLRKSYLEVREQAGVPRSTLPSDLEARWVRTDSQIEEP